MRSEPRVRALRIVPLLGALVVCGCEIERVAIPPTTPVIALHGILSATAGTQVVLLERTRSGTVPSYDLVDGVLSEPLAEKDALVELLTPSGRTLVATEDDERPENRGRGAGIYRFALPGDSLERGGEYRLRVVTSGGDTLSAATRVPSGAAASQPVQRTFDRSRDTVTLEWAAVAGARSYFVRIETPFGPRSFFTDSTRVRLTGGLRNVSLNTLPRVFVPGFAQAVTVSAVDANYYDWYRTHNERISGTGIVERVEGGIGLFGSLVRLRFEDLQVVVPQVEPVAGGFDFSGTPFQRSTTPYLSLELYVESRSARSDQGDALSGSYTRRPFLGMAGCVRCGLLGTIHQGRVELALLTDWFASDTAEVFTGELRGDTIVGTYRGYGGTVRFVRQ